MLRSVKDLHGFEVISTDGAVGTVDEVYFDDDKWTIRHLVIDSGGWLSGRKVLISPHAVVVANWSDHVVRVDLTPREIENSPGIDADKQVSRQHEIQMYDYYGYPYYWTGPFLWGYAALPSLAAPRPIDPVGRKMRTRVEQERARADPQLRTSKQVIGYDMQATDDEIGHVEDFLFNVEDWSIRMIVVIARNWWPGKHLLISPGRIERVSWNDHKVVVNITREDIENSPEYDASNPPSRDTRRDLYRHFEKAPSRLPPGITLYDHRSAPSLKPAE